jgi:hypothetical protein
MEDHGKAMGVGGVRQDLEFQSWLLRLGVRYLTGGSDEDLLAERGLDISYETGAPAKKPSECG